MKVLSFDEVNLVSGAGNVNWELRILLQWAVTFRDSGAIIEVVYITPQ